MKKYKLLKWYPSLPNWIEVGGEICYKENANGGKYYVCRKEPCGTYCVRLDQVENNPEFWELVVEKEYEILERKRKERHGAEFIHSIKRLSDGEIFTVRDNVAFDLSGNTMVIKSIYISDNELWISDKDESQWGGVKLRAIQHVKKPLFTTEDGVDVFGGEKYWMFSGDTIIGSIHAIEGSFYGPDIKRFSTKEVAERYVKVKDAAKRGEWLVEPCGRITKQNIIDYLTENLK